MALHNQNRNYNNTNRAYYDEPERPLSAYEIAHEKATKEVNRVEKLVFRYRDYNDELADAYTYVLGTKVELIYAKNMSMLQRVENRFTQFTRRIYDTLNGVSSK